MPSNSNKIVIASAGSGKTTFLVDEALSRQDRNIVIVTYTNNNLFEIKKKFYEKHGGVPKDVDVMTWFSFLLRECTRPYQRSVYDKRRVKTIFFTNKRSVKGVPHSEIERYYFFDGDEIYSDKISRFVIDCEKNTNGLVTKRLADIYDEVFVDEFQDLSGYDLDLSEVFLKANIRLVMVGDPRQCTYNTNNALKNKQYRGIGILNLINKWNEDNLCNIENLAISHRCNQSICDFADKLWPNLENTKSLNSITTEHDGIFVVCKNNIQKYVKRYSPAILRYSRSTKETYGYRALNFGYAKGMTFDRVLIIPHGPIKNYLRSGNLDIVKGSLEKFYVAVTRAKYSVAFLYDGACSVNCTEWLPEAD
jgi:DNA helicase-2/ATP-dependent DNA helicase PcrA